MTSTAKRCNRRSISRTLQRGAPHTPTALPVVLLLARRALTSKRRRLDASADALLQPAGVPAARRRARERAAEAVVRACGPGAEAGHIVGVRPALLARRRRRSIYNQTA